MLSRISASALTLALLAVPALQSPARADGLNGYDITAIRATNVVVRSGSCVMVPVSYDLTTGISESDPGGYTVRGTVEIEGWNGATNTGSLLSVLDEDSTQQSSITVADHYQWCPYLDGPGTMRLGPAHVDVETYDTGSNKVNFATYDDTTTTRFLARQASAVGLSIAKVKGKPKLRQFRIAPRFFSIARSGWVPWKSRTVQLQRLSAGKWVTVKRATTTTKGVALIRITARHGQRFRALVGSSAVTWNSNSATRTAP